MTGPDDYTDTPYASDPQVAARYGGIFPLYQITVSDEVNDHVYVFIDVNAELRLARQRFSVNDLESPTETSAIGTWVGRIITTALTGDGRDQCGDCGNTYAPATTPATTPATMQIEHAPDCQWYHWQELSGNPWRPDNLG